MKFVLALWKEISEWFERLFIRNIPGIIGIRIRRLYWKPLLKAASSFSIYPGCIITAPRNICLGQQATISPNGFLYAHNNGTISIGDRSSTGINVTINAADNGNIILGTDVLIGPNVVLRASNHEFSRTDCPIIQQGHQGGKIIVGNDVWIAANVVVLPNVRIGDGAIIGAGAVVTNDIPDYAIAVGVPARAIRSRLKSTCDKITPL